MTDVDDADEWGRPMEMSPADRHLWRISLTAAPDAIATTVADYRDPGEPQLGNALKLLEFFGARRGTQDIDALLTLLRSNGADADAVLVVESAALGRPPRPAADLARHFPDQADDGMLTAESVARYRRPHDVAAFVDALAATRSGLTSVTLRTFVTLRPMAVIARLELALRALGRVEEADQLVRIALDRSETPGAVSELISCQLAFGPPGPVDDESGIGSVVVSYVCDEMPESRLVTFIQDEYQRAPGRAAAWCARIAQPDGRPIAIVCKLADVLESVGRKDLAERITITVAQSRKASDLVTYAMNAAEAGRAVFQTLFEEASVRRDGDLLGDVLVLWSAHRDGSVLCHLIAEKATAAKLLEINDYLVPRERESLAKAALLRALDLVQPFTGREVVLLLKAYASHATRRRTARPDMVALAVVRRLSDAFATVSLDWFADFVTAAHSELSCDLADRISTNVGDAVYNRRNEQLSRDYLAALFTRGASVSAEAFQRRMAP